MKFDGAAFGKEIVGVVKGYLEKEIIPIAARLDALEKRIEAIPAPVDLSADLASIKAAVAAIEIPTVPQIPDIPAMIDEAIKAQMEVEDLEHSLEELVKFAVDAIPRPQDGKSITTADVAPMIAAEVEKRVSELPVAKDGNPGNDGIGLAGALIDRDGNLIITMTNGETKNLGQVVGRDGDPGRDGFGLEDFDATLMEDGRTVLLSFTGKAMDLKIELGFPVMLYRGIYTEGQYEKGDTVTLGGSLWHCNATKTTERPGDGSKDWVLAAKKGRDGKDGVMKPEKSIEPVRVGVPARSE